MIVTNIADAQVTANDLIEFNFRDIAYTIESANQRKLEGTVAAQTWADLDVKDALGSGPYKVTLGYVNHSFQAAPVEVADPDAMVIFFMAFPAGPNGPKTIVFTEEA